MTSHAILVLLEAPKAFHEFGTCSKTGDDITREHKAYVEKYPTDGGYAKSLTTSTR